MQTLADAIEYGKCTFTQCRLAQAPRDTTLIYPLLQHTTMIEGSSLSTALLFCPMKPISVLLY